MADLLGRLPEMTDDALATLRDNAVRLSRDGTDKQRTAADAVLPAILTELASRGRTKGPARVTKPRARKAAK